MFDTETLKYALPVIVVMIGWFVAHQFSVSRDRQNKRRDLRVQFLLEAYRRLEAAADRDSKDENNCWHLNPLSPTFSCWELLSKLRQQLIFYIKMPLVAVPKLMMSFG